MISSPMPRMAILAVVFTLAGIQAAEPPVLQTVPSGFTTIDIRSQANMGWADERGGDG